MPSKYLTNLETEFRFSSGPYHQVVKQGSVQVPKVDLPVHIEGPLSFYQKLGDSEPPGQ